MPRRTIVVGVTIAVTVLVASPTYAGSPHSKGPRTAGFVQVNQVSDQPNVANVTDGNLVNCWGLALGPTTPLWSANNGTSTATIYAGGVSGLPVTRVDRVVTVDGEDPTGEVFNDTRGFSVTRNGEHPATFIFSAESGTISAWNKDVSDNEAGIVATVPGAVFKSLALLHTPFGPFLLAADFANGRIDAFDSHFHLVNLPPAVFHDPRLPKGYAPFNIMVDDGHIFVTYAKQQAGSNDEAHGPGLGFVDEFRNFGLTVQRIASRGTLNAPWGLAIAPPGFGRISGALLVGNFGDGRINVFTNGHFAGQLRDTHNKKITIDGLWALLPGTATTGGTNTIWFSSGPNDEGDGLLGQLIPSS